MNLNKCMTRSVNVGDFAINRKPFSYTNYDAKVAQAVRHKRFHACSMDLVFVMLVPINVYFESLDKIKNDNPQALDFRNIG